jgi:hypothetical protein
MKQIPQQLIPLAVLFVVLLAVLVVARQLFVPDTFGEYGHYRAAAVDEVAALPAVYAGYRACIDCHDDIYQKKLLSSHTGLACETCHGAAAKHANGETDTLPNVPRGREHCQLCHGYNPARPTGFPQILPNMHNPGEACITCHDSHSPRLTGTNGECSACHRMIASQKAVSSHTSLNCTDCHTVPIAHATQPRLVRALKPTSTERCGRCHARGSSAAANVARIDMSEHGGRYLCWECHYPHFPEAKL